MVAMATPMRGVAQPSAADVLALPALHVSRHPAVAHKLSRLRRSDTGNQSFHELLGEIGALLACGLRWRGAGSIKLVGVIAARHGVQQLASALPDVEIHVAALDRELNERGYILPGLGDAGDRQFGT